jgi:hypothetical protein
LILENKMTVMTRHDNKLLTNSCANFGLDGFGLTAALRITVRLKEIKKRRALFGNQRVELSGLLWWF